MWVVSRLLRWGNGNRHEIAEAAALYPERCLVRITVPNVVDRLREAHIEVEHAGKSLGAISRWLIESYETDGMLISSADAVFPDLDETDVRQTLIGIVREQGIPEEKAERFVRELLLFIGRELKTMNEVRSIISIDPFGFWRLGDQGIAFFTQRKLHGEIPLDHSE